MDVNSITTLKPSQLIDFLTDAYAAGSDVWVHGPPGTGKTQIAEQMSQRLDCPIVVHPPAASMEPPDIAGLFWPDPKKGGMKRLPNTDLWPTHPDWRGLILLDELGQAEPDIQKCYMQTLCSRRIGAQAIPRGARFLATGNRKQDRAGVKGQLTPLLNRFAHVDLVVDVKDWQAWAVQMAVDPTVRAFINFRPGLLHQFDPGREERAFPTPRTWERVSRGLPHVREELVNTHVASWVGDAAAVEYAAFRQIYLKLPDPDQLLADPTRCALPDVAAAGGPAIYYALTGSLVERLRRDNKVAEKFVNLVDRFPREFSVLAMLDAKRVYPKVTESPRGQDWLRKHRDLLVA